ncbi:MAG: NAD(P)-dependent oxidoreductase [Nitrospirae bacterium]|nr:NAD(P)-dependent oxidoreductase [Nitrospirota bacterium]
MKALVTGATGFIGSHLTERLIKNGYEVSCMVRNASSLRWLEGLDVRLLQGDCSSRESLNNIAGFDYIFHLSGLTKANHAADFYNINTKATENIIDIAVRNNPNLKRFVFLSSLSAHGPSLNGTLPKEDYKPHPVSDYGRSKLLAEDVVLRLRDRLPVSILRPTAVYGPRDREMFLFFKMIKKKVLPYWGESSVSLVYIDDLINAIILAAEKEEAMGETFFISDGMVYSNREIMDEIAGAMGVNLIKLRLPKALLPAVGLIGDWLGKITRQATMINRDKLKELMQTQWICDISKAKQRLNFMPRVGLKEGIKWTVEWYKIHRWI